MIYDFIEIGSSDWKNMFNVMSGNGIVVEPMPHIYKKIPDLPNVIKLRRAIIDDKVKLEKGAQVKIHYFPEDKIPEKAKFLRSSSSIIEKQHTNFTDISEEILVPAMNIRQLINLFDVKEVKYLKIDAEGLDCRLLNHLLDYVNCPYIHKVQVETNFKIKKEEVEKTKENLVKRGFEIIKEGHDLIAENKNVRVL